MSWHTWSFDETKCMSFLMEDDELLEEYNETGDKVYNSVKKEFDICLDIYYICIYINMMLVKWMVFCLYLWILMNYLTRKKIKSRTLTSLS